MKRAIITVVGKDTVGIIAKVCTFLSEANVNVLDISQTIVSGYFNMMMIVDVSAGTLDFNTLSDRLSGVGEKIGCVIRIQLEDIFDMMHRI
ncbi:MAG: ACT domain-containing protein [Lachnospiraceae bacterium]|nr:ACT domain-containing protein [Lachnospiraceae bacterium]